MTDLRSFMGDSALREQVIGRLRSEDLPEYLSSGPMVFDTTECSPAGLISQGSDPSQFPQALGLPRWLAFALDEVAGGSLSKQALPRIAASIKKWPLGASLAPAAARVVSRVVLDAQLSVGRSDESLSDIHSLADQLCEMLLGNVPDHHQPAAKDPFRAVRRTANTLCEAQTTSTGRLLGRCVEAAAWSDLATSDTTVAEVLRAWRILQFGRADQALGWTEDVERRLDSIYSALESELSTRSDATPELFHQLLKERHPEEAALLQRYYSSRNEVAETLTERALSLLLGSLEHS